MYFAKMSGNTYISINIKLSHDCNLATDIEDGLEDDMMVP